MWLPITFNENWVWLSYKELHAIHFRHNPTKTYRQIFVKSHQCAGFFIFPLNRGRPSHLWGITALLLFPPLYFCKCWRRPVSASASPKRASQYSPGSVATSTLPCRPAPLEYGAIALCSQVNSRLSGSGGTIITRYTKSLDSGLAVIELCPTMYCGYLLHT